MKIFAKAFLLLFSHLCVMIVAYYTLGNNLQAGVYTANADNIGIPLMETAISLIVIFVVLALAFIFTNFTFIRKRVLHLTGVFLYLCGAGLAGVFALSWCIPNHYSISGAYGFVAMVAVTLAIFTLRRLFTVVGKFDGSFVVTK